MAEKARHFFGKLGVQVVLLHMILLLICIACRIYNRNTFTTFIQTSQDADTNRQARVMEKNADLVDIETREDYDGYISVQLKPKAEGDTSLLLQTVPGVQGDPAMKDNIRVDRFMTVYDRRTGAFTGDRIFLIANVVFWFGVAFLTLRSFLNAGGSALYSYKSIYTSGASIFSLTCAVQMLAVTARHLSDPVNFPMMAVYKAVHGMAFVFIMATTPFVLAFAIAMTVSNIELLRHERKRFQNFLGMIAGGVLVTGVVIAYLLYTREFEGPEIQVRIHDTLQGVYATVFAYFECALLGAIVCGIRSARHRPESMQDYVIILGCRFRKDGTLTPLLQGRVDRAVAFGKEQKEKTGRDIIYVPSGGQGPDECMPEGQAMGRYLRSQGIPEEQIMPECASRNTYENMAFSRKLIEERSAGANVIFSTTNYHVFRSGVWASLAGLKAEGIGSRTKWWFWPNAFMRECVGLLVNRWKQEFLALIGMTAFFAVLTMMLG